MAVFEKVCWDDPPHESQNEDKFFMLIMAFYFLLTILTIVLSKWIAGKLKVKTPEKLVFTKRVDWSTIIGGLVGVGTSIGLWTQFGKKIVDDAAEHDKKCIVQSQTPL